MNIDLINLATVAEDSFGSPFTVFSQKARRIMDHLSFLRGIPRNYDAYHLLNPNLGIIIMKYRPIVVTVHDLFPFTPIASGDMITQSYGLEAPILFAMKINMSFLKKADRIISVSEHTKKDLVSMFRIKPSRITVIHLGVDRELFHPRSRNEARRTLSLPINKKIILHVGVDEPRKNLRTLIEALHIVKQKSPEVILLRVGGMRDTTRSLIHSLKLKNSVLHYRNVPNIAPFYNASDLFVFPSYYEGFGLPVLEAMSSGIPVIAGESSSIPEIVGRAGILFSPYDSRILSEYIDHVLSDREIGFRLVAEGLKRSVEFDWDACAKKTVDVYRTLDN